MFLPPAQTFHNHCFQFLLGTIPVTPKEIETMLTSVTFGEQTGSILLSTVKAANGPLLKNAYKPQLQSETLQLCLKPVKVYFVQLIQFCLFLFGTVTVYQLKAYT